MVAPIFLLLVLGIVEFGRMFMIQQVLTNGSREGARRAIIEGSTLAEVESKVLDYLTTNSAAGASVEVSPSDLSKVGFGDSVTVKVTMPFDSVSWGPAWFLSGTTLEATSVMQGERLQ